MDTDTDKLIGEQKRSLQEALDSMKKIRNLEAV